MDVHVEEGTSAGDGRKADDARLFCHLAQSGTLDERVGCVDVAAGLDPDPELPVVDEEQPRSILGLDEGARREMTRLELPAIERRRGPEEVEHPPAVRVLSLAFRPMLEEQLTKLGGPHGARS